MKNLITFKLFESSGSYGYTMDDVKRLPGFMLLSAMGYYDSSTEIMKKNMTLRLYNEELGLDEPAENVTVYSNGYVRRIVPGSWSGEPRPRVMKKFDGENSLLRWQEQFLYIYDWTLKQYKKHNINSKYGIIGKSQFTNRNVIVDNMIENYPRNPAMVYSIYDHLTEIERKELLKGIKLTSDKFEENRRKYKMARRILNTWLK